MKKIRSLLVPALLFTILFYASCDGDQGDPGPKGDPGQTGENGQNGADGEDGNTNSFYFQNGFKGYESTADISITNNFDAFATPPTGESFTLYALQQENVDDASLTDIATSLIRFDNLKEVIEEEQGLNLCSGEFFVNSAILYLNGVCSTNGNETFLQLGILGATSPAFDETNATWEKANSTEPWAVDGAGEQWAFNDPILTSLGLANIGYLHNLDATLDLRTMLHQPFYIPGEAIKNWLCEEGSNKGLRISIHGNDGIVFIYSSEGPEKEMRPLLYINIDKSKDGQTGRMTQEDSFETWSKLSYEEKMEPFYKAYPELRVNRP